MKKTYINPLLQIVTIHASHLLAGSNPKISEESYNGTETIYGRKYDFFDED